jgi:hypothetical protein
MKFKQIVPFVLIVVIGLLFFSTLPAIACDPEKGDYTGCPETPVVNRNDYLHDFCNRHVDAYYRYHANDNYYANVHRHRHKHTIANRNQAAWYCHAYQHSNAHVDCHAHQIALPRAHRKFTAGVFVARCRYLVERAGCGGQVSSSANSIIHR